MRALSLVVLSSWLAWALELHAHEAKSADAKGAGVSGIVLSGVGVAAGTQHLEIDGRRSSTAGTTFSPILEVGYLSAWSKRWALGGLVRLGGFEDAWASAVGERRTRLDLRFASEASLPLAEGRKERPELTAALGFGPTVAWIQPQQRPSVVERYETGIGLHAALRAGVGLRMLGSTRCYFAMEGTYHRVATDRTAFVRGGTPHVRERYQFEDYSAGATFGVALPL